MKLRAFGLILPLALGLLAAPLPVEAQKKPGKVYRIGLLQSAFRSPNFAFNPLGLLGFLGYSEGENITLERRTAIGSDEKLPELAAELIRLNVDAVVASGIPAIRAAKNATKTIPIVMVAQGDPVRARLVASLARPDGNVTGVTAHLPGLAGKQLELLKGTVPGVTRVGVFWNPLNPDNAEEWRQVQVVAQALGVELQSLEVRSDEEAESAFEAAIRERCGALLMLTDPAIIGQAGVLTDLATERRMPTMWQIGPLVTVWGNLMSYGPSRFELRRRVAAYVDKILKGAKPADLPVERPTNIELVISMKAARALGLTIPPSVLIRADRVIE